MIIYVITIAGKLIPFDVESTNSVADLKLKIQEKEGISPERQNLIYFAQSLDDNKTLGDYSITNESKISLHFKRYETEIVINLPKSDEIALEYEPSDTIQTIKEKIHNKKGFPIEQQQLFYRYNQMIDTNLIADYLPKRTSKIFLLLSTRGGMIIFVNSTPFEVEPTDTILDLKNQISERFSISVEFQKLIYNFKELENNQKLEELSISCNSIISLETEPKIYILTVNLPTDERLEFEVGNLETIEEIKNKIKDVKQYPIEQQHLILNGKELENENSLRDYLLMTEYPTFDLIISSEDSILIFIDTPKLNIALPFKKTDTIKDIKNSIQQKSGIPIEQIKLTLDDQILIDQKTIEDSSILPDSRLILSLASTNEIQVAVQPIIGKPMMINVSQTDTIQNIKEKVSELNGSEIEKQKLFFNGQLLENDSKIEDYLIQNNSVLKLDYVRSNQEEIKVNLPNGETLKFTVDRKSKIEEAKEKIKELKEYPVDKQRLFLRFTELENMNSIENYSFINGGRVNLILISDGSYIIFVKTTADKFIPLEVKPTDFIEEIKAKIKNKEGFPVENQQLFYNGKEMMNGFTLQENGVTNDRAIINLYFYFK